MKERDLLILAGLGVLAFYVLRPKTNADGSPAAGPIETGLTGLGEDLGAGVSSGVTGIFTGAVDQYIDSFKDFWGLK